MKNKIIAFILVAVILLCVGIATGYLISKNQKKQTITPEGVTDSYEAGYEAAREIVENSNIIPTLVGETNVLKGRVSEIKDSQIVIEVNLINPLDDEKLKYRTVNVSEDTTITLHNEKNRETIRKEHDEYIEKMNDYRNGIGEIPTLPDIQIIKNININDLNESMLITVESDGNIRKALEFNAVRILVRQ